MMQQTGVHVTLTIEQNLISQQQQQQQITNTPIDSDVSSRRLPNLPPQDLLIGPRDDYRNFCLPLYQASIKCDWKAAKAILEERPELSRHSITENGETALHVAASSKAKGPKLVLHFVKNLVRLMTPKELEFENANFNTALYLAATAGNLETIKIMLEKNMALLGIHGGEGKMPLYAAAVSGNYDVVKYLYKNSNDLCDADGWTDMKRGRLLEKCVENDMFDVALQIVKQYPELGRHGSVLGILAQKPDAFSERKHNTVNDIVINKILASSDPIKVETRDKDQALQLLEFILDDIVKLPKNDIESILRGPAANNAHSSEALFTAAKMGNTVFVVELIRRYPDLMWKVNDSNQTIFHIAVENRHQDIYKMLYDIGYMKDSITSLDDKNGNNMLHLVAKIPKKKKLTERPGNLFQMHLELLWFKEVESMVNPSCRERKNKDGLTPDELFLKEHENLLAQSVNWVKGTTNQCMVVATLVATIAFAAAITIPGGYNQNNGIPIFYRDTAYTIFILADAISLSASSVSILLYISILTSRFVEGDFLESIPIKFVLLLSTLLLSITTMTISFSASFFVIYHKEMHWIPIVIILITACPVLLYLSVQYSLFLVFIQLVYASRCLLKPFESFSFLS